MILVLFRASVTFQRDRERLGALRNGAGASLGFGEVIGWRFLLVSNQGLIWKLRVSLGVLFMRILRRGFRLVVIRVLTRKSSTRSCQLCLRLVWVQTLAVFCTIPAFASKVLSADLGRGSLRAWAVTSVVRALEILALLVLSLLSAGVRRASRQEVRCDGQWPCDRPSFLIERVVVQVLSLGEHSNELWPGAVR